MFIRTQNEIISLMPTARWDRTDLLLGYLEEEEALALEPFLGTPLYLFLCKEYERLRDTYVDITSTTVKPTRRAKADPGVTYASVTDEMEAFHGGRPCQAPCVPLDEETEAVPDRDMKTIALIRICQQIEFYRMLSHKTGMLTVSFNEGGGMNMVSAEGYEPADEKRMERLVKDAYMSAGRSTDSLLLFLERDARGMRYFTDLWSRANAYYLHKDLLFQTALVLNEYLDIKAERMAYVELVHDIRHCQNTYLKPRIGARLLKAVVDYANEGLEEPDSSTSSAGDSSSSSSEGMHAHACPFPDRHDDTYDELLSLLRSALAFYVESRRQEIGPRQEKLARRDSMTDAQQSMAMACQFIEDNLDALGEAAKDSPVYKEWKERQEREEADRRNAKAACERRRRDAVMQERRKLFTAFPATKRPVDTK